MNDKFCGYCGERNLASAHFCGKCGKTFPEVYPTAVNQNYYSPKAKPISNLNRVMAIVRHYRIPVIIGGVFLAILISILLLSQEKPLTPSHYGVFVRQGNELIELKQENYFDFPTYYNVVEPKIITGKPSTILIWQKAINVDYLGFWAIGNYYNTATKVYYSITPKENGILELTSVNSLDDGVFCLMQGSTMSTIISVNFFL